MFEVYRFVKVYETILNIQTEEDEDEDEGDDDADADEAANDHDVVNNGVAHGDPLTKGYKYWMSSDRKQYRQSWYVTPDVAAQLVSDESVSRDSVDVLQQIDGGIALQRSSEGCTKVRKQWHKLSRKDRTGLWIWVCLRHHHIVGFHMMVKPEGLRDAIYSLYRFKEVPPTAIFYDFACASEESALNWLPDYFKDVSFYHDVFHGMTHKCGNRFRAKRLDNLKNLDTSVMEQVSLARGGCKYIQKTDITWGSECNC
jgi:hypothetical protein